jgi:hypothetical protein
VDRLARLAADSAKATPAEHRCVCSALAAETHASHPNAAHMLEDKAEAVATAPAVLVITAAAYPAASPAAKKGSKPCFMAVSIVKIIKCTIS